MTRDSRASAASATVIGMMRLMLVEQQRRSEIGAGKTRGATRESQQESFGQQLPGAGGRVRRRSPGESRSRGFGFDAVRQHVLARLRHEIEEDHAGEPLQQCNRTVELTVVARRGADVQTAERPGDDRPARILRRIGLLHPLRNRREVAVGAAMSMPGRNRAISSSR